MTSFFFFSAIFLTPGFSQQSNQDRKRPNIFVFIADDLGDGDLGCYGHSVLNTPNVDRMSREGMRFTAAFLSISSCSPSRSSILTGRYPHNTGAEDLHQPLPNSQKTLAAYLRESGYYCASVGKWHLGNGEKANWDRVTECLAPNMADETSAIIENRPASKPLFLWIASIDPHRPYADDGLETEYREEEAVVPPYLPDHPLIRKDLTHYYAEISRFDAHIGRIRAKLEAEGLWENSIAVFLSDNGMPFPRAKTTLYDSGIRTPLIVRWPRNVEEGSVSRQLISAVDLSPTLLEAADVSPTTMHGKSFMRVLKSAEQESAFRHAIFAEANWHDFEKFTRAVRTQRYKLIRNYYWDVPLWNSVDSINSATWKGMLESREAGELTGAQEFLFQPTRPFEEFYDLQSDPYELNNLIDDQRHREAIWNLRIRLDNWRVETDDRMPELRTPDGWTREGNPLPHNQPWYDRWMEQGGENKFDKF